MHVSSSEAGENLKHATYLQASRKGFIIPIKQKILRNLRGLSPVEHKCLLHDAVACPNHRCITKHSQLQIIPAVCRYKSGTWNECNKETIGIIRFCGTCCSSVHEPILKAVCARLLISKHFLKKHLYIQHNNANIYRK